MTFSDELKALAETVLDSFDSENVVYTPHAGTPRTIVALVSRRPLKKQPEIAHLYQRDIEVQVLNDPTDGITPASISPGDTISLPAHVGGTAEAFSLRAGCVVSEDAGMITLAL